MSKGNLGKNLKNLGKLVKASTDDIGVKFSAPTKITVTNHPVTNYSLESLKSKNGVFTAKELWHELRHSFDSYNSLLKNFKDKDVSIRSWKHGDRDRHPDEQTGISTLGSILEKASILDSIEVPINETLKQNIENCVDELIERFDTREKNKSDFHEVIAKYQTSISTLNGLWESNLETVRKIHAGSDYRVSSSDLKDSESQTKVVETLREMRESKADITRLIIADCENAKQVEIARKLAKDSGLELEVLPLLEDRIEKTELQEIIKATAQGTSKLNIMIAGSDSDRRIHKAGVTNLVFKIIDGIKEYMEENPGQIENVNFFTGTGNSVFRTQKLPHFIPTLMVDGKNIVEVETTVQGQSFHALADKEFSELYLEKHEEGLSNRPSQQDVAEVRELFSELDKTQENSLKEHGDDPILNTKIIKKILDNSKVFGSRFKDVKFEKETISQNDLLNKTRAIDHAWIWQITGVVPTGVKDFCEMIENADLRQKLIDHKDNVYTQKLAQDILQMTYYCDADLAKNYYCNEEVLREDFEKLNEVKSFVKSNFPDIFNEIDSIMKDEYKHYDKSAQEFENYWKEFEEFRQNLHSATLEAVEKDEENKVTNGTENAHNVAIARSISNYYSRGELAKNSGGNYSTMVARDVPNSKVNISGDSSKVVNLALGENFDKTLGSSRS